MIGRLEGFFSGYKGAWRSSFDSLQEAILSIEPQVKVIVHTVYIIFVEPETDRVFASIHFIAREMYLGLALPGGFRSDRIIPGGMLKYRGITSAVKLSSPEEIDNQVIELLRVAHGCQKSF